VPEAQVLLALAVPVRAVPLAAARVQAALAEAAELPAWPAVGYQRQPANMTRLLNKGPAIPRPSAES
jgi:hypothetical protein